MTNSTFPGEPGKPDLNLFEDLSAPEPEDDGDLFEELEAVIQEQGDSRIIELENGGRIMPHPLTGKPTRFARASGFAISDETILTSWKVAMAVLGVGKFRDIYALANSTPMPKETITYRKEGWWMPWFKIGRIAWDRAGSMAGAHEGTSFHAWREQVEASQISRDDVPEEWQEHIDRFLEMHQASAMSVVPEYVEQLVVTLKLHNGVCGKLDNLRRLPDGSLIIDDTKTGKSAPDGKDEMAIQFAIYANAEWWWAPDHPDATEYGYIPAPARIRKDVATISWVPINEPSRGRIIPLDIVWGWRAAQVCAWLKGYRNRAKRKNNGLELPLSAVWNEDMASSGQQTKSDYTARISACVTLDELSAVYIDMLADGEGVSPSLERFAHARKIQIKNGDV